MHLGYQVHPAVGKDIVDFKFSYSSIYVKFLLFSYDRVECTMVICCKIFLSVVCITRLGVLKRKSDNLLRSSRLVWLRS